MMTTGSFYRMYSEQYSTRGHGPATISVNGDLVSWTLDVGGVSYGGNEPIIEGAVEAALYRVRKTIDGFDPASSAPLLFNQAGEVIDGETEVPGPAAGVIQDLDVDVPVKHQAIDLDLDLDQAIDQIVGEPRGEQAPAPENN